MSTDMLDATISAVTDYCGHPPKPNRANIVMLGPHECCAECAKIVEAVLDKQCAIADYDQVQRLGIDKWKPGEVGKHKATNDTHLRAVLSRLTAAGDNEAAETIAWLIWHRQLEANWKLYFCRLANGLTVSTKERD